MKRKVFMLFFILALLSSITGCTRSAREEEGELTQKLTAIYDLAVESAAFEGTYEEWLETVRGPEGVPGTDGREVEFTVSESHILWRHAGDAAWIELIGLDHLRGQPGEPGADGLPGEDGRGIVEAYLNEENELVLRFTDDTDVNLGHLLGFHTVIFLDEEDYELKRTAVIHGFSASPPQDPEKEGHLFMGWDKDFQEVEADLVVRPCYEVKTTTISFDTRGGEAVACVRGPFGETFTLPEAPFKAGYVFDGWFMDPGLVTPFTGETIPKEDIVLHAAWVEQLDIAKLYGLSGFPANITQHTLVTLAGELLLDVKRQRSEGMYYFDFDMPFYDENFTDRVTIRIEQNHIAGYRLCEEEGCYERYLIHHEVFEMLYLDMTQITIVASGLSLRWFERDGDTYRIKEAYHDNPPAVFASIWPGEELVAYEITVSPEGYHILFERETADGTLRIESWLGGIETTLIDFDEHHICESD